MKVSAIIVTRGDVDLTDVIAALPREWETLIWDNGDGRVYCPDSVPVWGRSVPDLAVYGRYAAIEYASNDLIYVMDDDILHSDPQAIVDAWHANRGYEGPRAFVDHVVCNMPANFRHNFYKEHALVGFGACFHRDAPARAFARWADSWMSQPMDWLEKRDAAKEALLWFRRTCDIVFTALTPRVLVDVPYEDMPWATAENRMWKQSYHREERQKMLDLCKEVLHART